MTCDGCHEDWEGDFFCPLCSEHEELREVERPALFWDGLGPDTEVVEEYVTRAICFNCCPGHVRADQRNEAGR